MTGIPYFPSFRVIDFETTGLPPDADVIEVGYVDVIDAVEQKGATTFVKPTRPIGVEARAAHHLSDEIVAHGISWEKAKEVLAFDGIYVAHKAELEKAFFNPEGSRWIDTYKCALRLWPDAPKHSNQVLRYFLEGCDPGEQGMPPHRSLPDCCTTVRILGRCLMAVDMNVDQLVQWSDEPPLLPKVPMGKHFGKTWSEVPTDYLEWATKQTFDEGVAHTVRVELAKRKPPR